MNFRMLSRAKSDQLLRGVSTLESLSVIGRADSILNVMHAFGHRHLSFTWAAVEALDGQQPQRRKKGGRNGVASLLAVPHFREPLEARQLHSASEGPQ